jgi:NAD(P)H-dependent FMN reductase
VWKNLLNTDDIKVEFLDFADIPYMNQDIEFPPPDSVARVRNQVAAADAVWIFSPEYDLSIPGLLKNLLDWLSRPYVANDWSSGTAAMGKPVTITSCAGKSAGLFARDAIYKVIDFMRMDIVDDRGVGISMDEAHNVTGVLKLTDDDKANLEAQAAHLLARL